MKKSKTELIFPIFFIFICIFASISQKMAGKNESIFFLEKIFFLRFSWKFPYTVFFRINARDVYWKMKLFRGAFIQEECSFERGVYLQTRSIVDIAVFFNTRQAFEKSINLYNNLFICFILDHIHFLIGILFIRGRNEWI